MMNHHQKEVIKAAITAVGAYVPDTVLTNQELENMVDTSDSWITSRTGIKERRILKEPGKATSFLAIQAAQNLIQKKQLDPLTIDLVMVATITPDVPVAATAAYVASQIGASNAFAYDLQAACSGFLYGMSTAAAYISSGRYNKVLLIGADMMSSIVDYTDRTTCIIFGDGAGAALFEPNTEGYGWEDEYFRSNGTDRDALRIKAGGPLHPTTQQTLDAGDHFIRQDGQTVYKYAVTEMAHVTETMLQRNSLTASDVSYLVPHQANKRIVDATAKLLEIHDDKVLMNIAYYGNTTAATLPLLLNDFENNFKKGDKLIFAAFGGGFTWGAAYLTWAY